MKKSAIFWLVSLSLTAGLILWWWRTSFVESANTRRLDIARVSGPAKISETLTEALQSELSQSLIIFWGVLPEDQRGLEVLKTFVSAQKFDEVWVDGPFQNLVEGRPVFLRKNEELVRSELLSLVSQGKRILLVSSPIDVNSSLEGSSAWKINRVGDMPFVSISVSEFPRLRTQEPQMKIPCVLPHADQTGTGWFGCQILNIARSTYRQRFSAGNTVMLIEQIGSKDFILLMAVEPEV